MPVVRRQDFGTPRAPEWAAISSGIVAMGCSTRTERRAGDDAHFHDCEEFWFVLNGKARVRTEGTEHVVGSGDVVCTKMGEDHEIVEIVEAPYTQVWIECNLRGKRRTGHLYKGKDD